MATVAAAPLPFDWDALRTPEWHERRARRRAVRAEFQRARDIGLVRRHAAKLAYVHRSCTVGADGTVRCVVDPLLSLECPSRLRLVDPNDWPGVVDGPGSACVVPADQVEVLTREEALAWIQSRARTARCESTRRSAGANPPIEVTPPGEASPPGEA